MQSVREFLQTKPGQISAAALLGIAVVVLLLSLRSFFIGNPANAASIDRLFICAETGKTFHYSVKKGDSIPVQSPYSGKGTGYPAELCYWTKDGHVKDDPTPVLLNKYKGDSSPTFCPDCGRLVVPHNPHPMPQMMPPPTQEQYKPRKGAARDAR